MYSKGSKYLADWYDKRGIRKRKSFDSPDEATAHEEMQKGRARPKAKRATISRVRLPASSKKATKISTRGKSQNSSAASTARSRHPKLARAK